MVSQDTVGSPTPGVGRAGAGSRVKVKEACDRAHCRAGRLRAKQIMRASATEASPAASSQVLNYTRSWRALMMLGGGRKGMLS